MKILKTFKAGIVHHNLGSLSSFDYVDFVLKKGDYEKIYPEIDPILVDKSSIHKNPQCRPNWSMTISIWSGILPSYDDDKKILRIRLPEGYNSIFSGIKLTQFCTLDKMRKDMKKVEQLSKTLNKIREHVIAQDLKHKADQQPIQVRTIFHDVINDMKQNRSKYDSISKLYQMQFKALSDLQYEIKKTTPEGSSIIKNRLDQLKSHAREDLAQYSFNREMLERLGRLDEFSKKATPEQKRNFLELLKSEWEPL